MIEKAVQDRIDAMDARERDKLIELVASVMEVVAVSTVAAVERRLRELGVVQDDVQPTPSVYFIQAVDGGPIKIGYAKDPEKRLRELQRSSPHELRILAREPGEIRLERELHERYSEWRLHGEWFSEDADGLRLYINQASAAEREMASCT